MALTNKQKEYINNNAKRKSVKKIAGDLNVSKQEVSDYIATLPKKRTPVWFYLVAFILPFLFFILLEIILNLSGYGMDRRHWEKVTGGKYLQNAEIARRWFYDTKNIPYSSKDFFDIEKKANAFRVFVMGGSSAAGFPYSPVGSFSKYLRKRLEVEYPGKHIEVVNVSMAAINSFALLDMLPGILEQKPDLILIYAGHNEYYGALGVGSRESLGSSRELVNLSLYLNKYKTFQLVRNGIKGAYSLFAPEPEKRSGTLMARMATEQEIPYKSEKYYAGIKQFKGNLEDIIKKIQENGIPVMIGSLTSNLKDQNPFISVQDGDYPPASQVYEKALNVYSSGSRKNADSLFRYAKDLDALRFRAPEDINAAIYETGKNLEAPVVDVDKKIAALSPGGITGDNIMTDHLHPTIEGYRQIGRFYFEALDSLGLLPQDGKAGLSYEEQDSLARLNFDFTGLDSTIAAYRIAVLKSDWPYSKNRTPLEVVIQNLGMTTYSDTLALQVVRDQLNWEKAHRLLAQRYLEQGEKEKFIAEMEVVMDTFPVIYDYYNITAKGLLDLQDYDAAYEYLIKKTEKEPDAFSTKWLGMINLNRGNNQKAVEYFRKSLEYNGGDTQTLYNMAGAYINMKEYETAVRYLNRILSVSPKHMDARKLKIKLSHLLN